MIGDRSRPRIPLPKQWPSRVRSGVLHAISLAHFSLTFTRSWAAAKMNATLALLTPDDIEDALRFVEICERGDGTPAEEADEWRRRILGWQAFLGLEGGWPA